MVEGSSRGEMMARVDRMVDCRTCGMMDYSRDPMMSLVMDQVWWGWRWGVSHSSSMVM